VEVRFVLTRNDYWSFLTYALFRRRQFFLVPVLLFFIFAAISLLTPIFGDPSPLTLLLWLLVFNIPLLLLLLRLRRVAARAAAWGGAHLLTISPAGFRIQNSLHDARHAWRAVKAIEQDQRNLYILMQSVDPRAVIVGQIIPKRAFATAHESATFLRQARQYWREACRELPAQSPGTPPGERLAPSAPDEL
jgi:hypothetical protein